ncbi:hypothetical protein Tsubulata_038476, partial [Turnera subulata]
MGRRQNDPDPSRFAYLILLVLGAISCALVYAFPSVLLNPNAARSGFETKTSVAVREERARLKEEGELELWGAAVKWGSEFKFNSSEECCQACKAMCTVNDGPCLCDTWVFCGNREACGSKFGECWLKKQDMFVPDRQEGGSPAMWTSGIIFGKGQFVILELLAGGGGVLRNHLGQWLAGFGYSIGSCTALGPDCWGYGKGLKE